MKSERKKKVPFYSQKDKLAMYTVGSVFYGIYFYVAFPMFFMIDEASSWSIFKTAQNSLASCMIVFIFLDLWRLIIK